VASLLARLADSYAKLVENLEHVRLGYLARARTALKNLNRRSATPRESGAVSDWINALPESRSTPLTREHGSTLAT
jgi:hypothetical protein